MLEQFGVFAKKYLFPIVIIFFGLMLVIKGGTADADTHIMQTKGFLYGGLSILAMGVITILYMLDIINKIVHISLMVILLCVTIWLTATTISSVKDTIVKIDTKKETDKFVKQALSDIRECQLEFKKKYGLYAENFAQLSKFLKNDKVMDINKSFSEGYTNLPEGKIEDPEHIAILGYDVVKDEKLLEEYDEIEAVKVGIMIYDTVWYDVMDVLFTSKEALMKERSYVFEINNLAKVPMNDTAEFVMKSDTLDDGTPVFMAKNPHPYDPFNTKDTLMIGSLKESRTTGNWSGAN